MVRLTQTLNGLVWAIILTATPGFIPSTLGQATHFAWATASGGSQEDYALGVAIDSSTNLLASGTFYSQSISLQGTALQRKSSTSDSFVAKFDSWGNLLWGTNFGASGGFESQGSAIATDSSNDLYLTGFFSGAVTIGGNTLTNNGGMAVYVAKFDSNGTPLWSTNSTGPYGGYDVNSRGYDLTLDISNNCYVTGGFSSGYSYTMNFGPYALTNVGQQDFFLAKIDPFGNMLWARSGGGTNNDFGFRLAVDSQGSVYVLGDFTSATCTFAGTTLTNRGSRNVFLLKYDGSGTQLWAKGIGGGTYDSSTGIAIDRSNHVVLTALSFSTNVSFGNLTVTNQNGISGDGILAECDQAGTAVALTVLPFRPGGIATDSGGNLFFGSGGAIPPSVAKYSPSGLPLWTAAGASGRLALDLGKNVYVAGWWQSPTNLTLDDITLTNHGLDDFYIAKLVQLPPTVVVRPTNELVAVGAGAAFSSVVTGAPSFTYQWQFNGSNIAGATGSALSLTNCQVSDAGAYSVSVTNDVGSTNSLPGILDVRYVLVRGNGQLLSGSDYSFPLLVTVSLETGFTNGSIFYTLDGTEPSFASTYYTGAFVLTNSATIRAIAYSADFTEYGESPPLTIKILHCYTVTASSAGGGSVSLAPPSGPYLEDTQVQVQAIANAGWTFLQWLGDANSPGSNLNITVKGQMRLEAIFGTTLSTTIAGNGTVQLSPIAALYPYGTVARLCAAPQSGNYFGVWGNAASGNTNPLFFTVTNPNPIVSSLFATLGANQVALNVLPIGNGNITVTPRANVYTAGASVMLAASPDPGQTFLGWTGNAGGTQNPLILTMNQSKAITGNFTEKPTLSVQNGLDGMTGNGFRLTLSGDPGSGYRIDGTTNLTDWQAIGTLTNVYGVVQFTDPAGTNLPRRFYRAGLLP